MRSKMGVGECLCVCMCARGVKITLSLLEETVLCGIAQCTDPPPPQDFLRPLYTSSSFFDIFVHLTVQQSLSLSLAFLFLFYLYLFFFFYTSLISVRRLCPNRVGLYPCLPACLSRPLRHSFGVMDPAAAQTPVRVLSIAPLAYILIQILYVVFRYVMFGGDCFLVHTKRSIVTPSA